MGSASDIPVIEKGVEVLDKLGIPYEVAIASAHRTPRDVEGYAVNASKRG
ncbi:MAG: AIR carboxylase family protein, partial [Synergistaceae bacterium]